jgi:hypothetical protein
MPDEQDMYLLENGDEELDVEEQDVPAQKVDKAAQPANELGKMPQFLTKPVHEDQVVKINDNIKYLYTQDLHLGDDLALLAKLARTQPDKFDNFLSSFRAEYM